jgi:hypothetical protein
MELVMVGPRATEIVLKPCKHCGKTMPRGRYSNGQIEPPAFYKKRKYCNLECSALGQRKDKPSRGAIGKRNIRHRKRNCEDCGTTESLGIHHIDHDWMNNDLANLMTLCATCHTTLHWAQGKRLHNRTAPPCKVDGCGTKSRRRGLCPKHHQRWKRWGDPMLVKNHWESQPHRADD